MQTHAHTQDSKQDLDQYACYATSQGATIFHPTRGNITVRSTHPNWQEVQACLKNGQYATAIRLLDRAQALRQLDVTNLTFAFDQTTGLLTLPDGMEMRDSVYTHITQMVAAGHPTKPLANFLNRLAANPQKHVWNEALLFMEANSFTLFENGHILGYKAVRPDFTDKRTGTINNSPGRRVTMPRQQVDDDRRVSCSTGLHVASHSYALGFASTRDRLLVVMVDPVDIVSIPYDYDNQKMRTCGYDVVAALAETAPEPLTNKSGIWARDLRSLDRTSDEPGEHPSWDDSWDDDWKETNELGF